MMLNIRSLIAALTLSVLAPFVHADNHAAKGDIIEVAREAGSFTTLLTAIDAAGLTATLKGEGPFTVFAPTDAAFAALPAGTLEGLLADTEKLTAVLTYHVVAGKAVAADVVGMTSVTTLQGGSLPISTENGVKIGSANVVTTDVMTSNGVIHVIDAVLVP